MLSMIIFGAIGLVCVYFSPLLLIPGVSYLSESAGIREWKNDENVYASIIGFVMGYIIVSKLKLFFL